MLPALDVWLNHFEYHGERRPCVPNDVPGVLKPDERAAIADSIATFQLGEQSQGLALLTAAWRFAQTHNLPQLVRITELFIREEQHHAELLGEFMDQHGIPRKHSDWTDHVFRRLRRMGDYETFLSVLVTAELIGNVYYRALEAATNCRQLRLLCRLLVADELAHVAFESDLLLAIRARKSPPRRRIAQSVHRAFLLGSAWVVWQTHHPVLRRAGYTALTFVRACDVQFAFYLGLPGPATGSSQPVAQEAHSKP